MKSIEDREGQGLKPICSYRPNIIKHPSTWFGKFSEKLLHLGLHCVSVSFSWHTTSSLQILHFYKDLLMCQLLLDDVFFCQEGAAPHGSVSVELQVVKRQETFENDGIMWWMLYMCKTLRQEHPLGLSCRPSWQEHYISKLVENCWAGQCWWRKCGIVCVGESGHPHVSLHGLCIPILLWTGLIVVPECHCSASLLGLLAKIKV